MEILGVILGFRKVCQMSPPPPPFPSKVSKVSHNFGNEFELPKYLRTVNKVAQKQSKRIWVLGNTGGREINAQFNILFCKESSARVFLISLLVRICVPEYAGNGFCKVGACFRNCARGPSGATLKIGGGRGLR